MPWHPQSCYAYSPNKVMDRHRFGYWSSGLVVILSEILLCVKSPCRGEGSRTELSVAGGGTMLESCRCKVSWEGSPSQNWSNRHRRASSPDLELKSWNVAYLQNATKTTWWYKCWHFPKNLFKLIFLIMITFTELQCFWMMTISVQAVELF